MSEYMTFRTESGEQGASGMDSTSRWLEVSQGNKSSAVKSARFRSRRSANSIA